LKSDVDVRKMYEIWRVTFMDANQLAAARFYFTKLSVLYLPFLWNGNRYWTEGVDTLKERQRWSPSCGFPKGMWVANNPILSKVHQKNHLKNLPVAATCMAHISS